MAAVDRSVETRLLVNTLARHVALLGLSSVIAGVLIGGIGGRVVMRVSAVAAGPEMVGRLTENGNRIGDITVGGTLTILVFAGALLGVLASVLVVVSEPWLRWMRALKGLGFGLVGLAIFGDFTSVDFFIIRPSSLNVAMFVGLAAAFGFATQGTYLLLDRRLRPATEREQPGYLIIDAAGGPALFLNLLFFTSSGFCGCDPAHGIGALLLIMLGSTVVRYASTVVSAIPDWVVLAASFTGYGSLALVLTFGLARVVNEIQRIL